MREYQIQHREQDPALREPTLVTETPGRLPRHHAAASRGGTAHGFAEESDETGALTREASRPAVQMFARAVSAGIHDVKAIAAQGVAGGGTALPHLAAVQRSFGRHDVSGVRAFIGGEARRAATALGAAAYAMGEAVAFATSPTLQLVAHEAAHVVQQRGGVQLDGDVGQAGDRYEQHADAVADRVARGESVEALLDPFAGGGGGGAPSVQKWEPPGEGRSSRERTEIERTQTWDPTLAEIAPGLGEQTAAIGAAIVANSALHYSALHIVALRRALGLATHPHAFDRALIAAIIARQTSLGVVTTPPGVVDEATVRALDPGASWEGGSGALRHYAQHAPWTELDDERLEVFRTTLVPALRVRTDDLTLSPVTRHRSRHAVVTEHFVRQAYTWQFWHGRDRAMATGRLSPADLAELGLVPRTPTVDAAAPASAEELAAEAVEDTIVPSESPTEGAGATDEMPSIPGRLSPAELRSLRREIAQLRPQLTRAFDPAAALPPALTALRDRLSAGIEANDWIAVSYEWLRPRSIATALTQAARIALGESVDPPRRQARPSRPGAAPAAPDGAAPALELRSAEQARAHLHESGVYVGDSRDPARRLTPGSRGWDARVVGGQAGLEADQTEVVMRAHRSIAAMDALTARMTEWRRVLVAALDHPSQLATIVDVLTRLRAARAELRAPTFLPRGAWQPTFSDRSTAMPAHPIGPARTWLRELDAALRQMPARTDHYRTMATRDPHTDFVRGPALTTVDVNLHATGVEVTRAHGGRLGDDEMRLDPQFADALVRFIENIRGLGVTTMRTNGLLRLPLSFEDTHPRGQAADICGFVIHGFEIHLRNGHADPARPDAFSDWHNTTPNAALNGQSPAMVLRAITARMASYFSLIVGPGHNAAHDTHWHVQLTGSHSSTERGVSRVMVISEEPAATD